MRALTLFAFLFSASLRLGATHIIGGALYYDHLGGDQYRVMLEIYRDCGPGNVSGTGFDAAATIGVFGGDGTFISYQALTFPGAQLVEVDLDNPCLTAPPTICVELAVYTGTFDLPARPDGYHLSYQRCCRTPTIINIAGAQDAGLTCTVRIPPAINGTNSAARFTQYPPAVLCLDEGLEFDHSATDADGDSLVYELCSPYNGGSQADPIPLPLPPPYTEVEWSNGYSDAYPMDADPGIAIDPGTGLLTVRPSLSASYTVAIRVKEYREGVLLSETRRDFRFDVVPCQNEVTALIAPQSSSSPDQFCAGLVMDFENISPTGQTWHWDFGETNSLYDTSSVESPTWFYSAPGTYLVTLVANPGLTCTDTTQAEFQVYPTPGVFFELPTAACGGLTTEFVALGGFSSGATFAWDFGPDAIPQTASSPIVNVELPPTGVHTVSVTVTDHGCVGSHTEEVLVNPVPTAGFSVWPPSPQPFGTDVLFQDGSVQNGTTITQWEWTANGNHLGEGGTFLWPSPLPGTYEVQLAITSADGCTSTYTVPYEIIEVPIIIPNVFTPNGDGSNDRFSIRNIEQHKNELKVYDRWGLLVYEATNYQNQWSGVGVPDGTYYYELLLLNGRSFKGHFTVLR
ncbi:MAG: gliding motility-associated C-terminal domain-containing protein [Flavobacteriales bacterium]|nr:gliding motility-associated C-terminal domain-containing protein [Flavobacteriales bacterium]